MTQETDTERQSDSTAQNGTHGLKGKIGTIELVLTVLAFTAPAVVVSGQIPFVIQYGLLGAPLIFVVAAVILLLFAVGYVAMTRHIPNPGAFYAYVTAALGRESGLGASFLALAGYGVTAVGAQVFFGMVVSDLIHTTFNGPLIPWPLLSFVGIVLSGVFGYFRIDLSAKLLTIAMSLEVIMVTLFNLSVFTNGGPVGRTLEPFTWGAFTSGSFFVALLLASISFLGFEATAVFREEVKDRKKTVTRATYIAVIFIGVFYVLTTWLTIVAYGNDAVSTATNAPGSMVGDAMGTYMGAWAHDTLSVLLCTSIFAVIISVQNICSRYLFSLGTDHVLPPVLGKVHAKHGSPHVASLIVSAVLVLGVAPIIGAPDPLALYITLVGTGGFAIYALMALTAVAVVVFFVKRRMTGERDPLWQTVIAPGLGAVGLGTVTIFSIFRFDLLAGGSIETAVMMLSLVAAFFIAGAIVAAVFKRKRPEIYARIGRQKV